MKYVVLFWVLLLPYSTIAQTALTGLGKYTLGRTTPDSLNQSEFSELDQAYVKGTIALPCAHIRTFKATSAIVNDIAINNVLLFIYDNQLFKISCNYNDALKRTFVQQHGEGKAQPKSRFTFCDQSKTQAMMVGGEIWQNGDTQALAVHASGYNANCRQEETNQLIIKNLRITDLASDCELPTTNPYAEEFDKVVNER